MTTTSAPTTSSSPSGPTTIIKNGTTAYFNLTSSNITQKSIINDLIYNGTGYFIEEETESGLNDLQTLLLACFATLVPLVISLLTAFGIRVLWTKYKRRARSKEAKCDGILERVDSDLRPLHCRLIASDKKPIDVTINTDEEVQVLNMGTATTTSTVSQMSRNSHHSNTNGSIITMTLKNNHLIVETEERNDIEEDSRETTMKYSPSARDGVFVVEVQQGMRRSPPSSSDPVSSDQCALVHSPPEKYSYDETLEELDDIDSTTNDPEPSTSGTSPEKSTKTGLTQSTTSLTSGRHSYCYSNQQSYGVGRYGYTQYDGCDNDVTTATLNNNKSDEVTSEDNVADIVDDIIDIDKPKITAAVLKSGNTESLMVRCGNNSKGGDILAEADVGSADLENGGPK